ncbi:MAG: phasin family protein [Arenimonas sp.]|nr:phasin family protein [Arenimonas sp.]
MATLKKTARTKTAARKPAKAASARAESASRNLLETAQQIWAAGVGALARAQGEGTDLFEALVKKGMSLETQTRKLATGKVGVVRDAVEDRVDDVREKAADTWDRMEKVFEDRVQRALTRLGVPTREDLGALSKRVEMLTAELRKQNGKPAAAKPKAPAKKSAARKPAAKGASAQAKVAKKAGKVALPKAAAPHSPKS